MYGIKDYVDPVEGKFRVTSEEGPRKSRRTTNGAKMSSFHYGVDIAGEKPGDQPLIRNVTGGRVVFAGQAGGWGNTVIVENPDGYRVQYGHLDSIGVRIGDYVPAGEPVGVMGATGNVTGTHLDMIVTKDGKAIKRDGTALGKEPASISRRAELGKKAIAKMPDVPPAPTKAPTSGEQAEPNQAVAQTENALETSPPGDLDAPSPVAAPSTDMFAGVPVNILSGSVGLIAPDTKTENRIFGGIAKLGLEPDLEGLYAEAARAIAGRETN